MALKKIAPICPDLQELDDIIKLIPDDRKHIARKLADEIAFMGETLDELKTMVRQSGTVELFKQGKQEFLRESPALKGYNTTIQRYSLLFRQLADLLPKQTQDNADSALYEFIKQG